MKEVWRLLLFAGSLACLCSGKECNLDARGGDIWVGGEKWLAAGSPCVRFQGEERCHSGMGSRSAAGEFVLGADELGHFNESVQEVATESYKWVLGTRKYLGSNTYQFFQHFGQEFTGTALPGKAEHAAIDGVASWFPAFQVPSSGNSSTSLDDDGPDLGILYYSGTFSGQYYDIRPFRAPLNKLASAIDSGPVVLFSQKCALVLSPSDNFMSASVHYNKAKTEFGFGVLGSVTSIPKGFRTGFIASASPIDSGAPDGIRQAMLAWGSKLRRLHHTSRTSDVTLVNLQFSTDNGAYYYYHTESNKTYEETILDVHAASLESGIPFRQWLMDSWWYFKERGGEGLKNWTARPEVFPHGIAYVTEKTNWDIVAHNRWFAGSTDYARQNGGEYDFVIEGDWALPLEQRFWDDLFKQAKLWGLRTYEQDWLYNQFRAFNYTLQTIGNARTWLLQMGHAAQNAGLNIQYCMSWPRHVLQTLEIPAVSQVRASDDYIVQNNQWAPLGVTSMFLQALHLVPSKDNFWSSTQEQGGITRYGHTREVASRLQAMVSTLSRGPVAPSDRVDLLDAKLIMRSCSASGRLLRPDVPAVNTDHTILAKGGIQVSSAQRDMVFSTFSSLGIFRYTLVLAARSPAFQLGKDDLYRSDHPHGDRDDAETIAWNVDEPFKPLSLPIDVPKTDKKSPVLICVAPVFANGWAFLGEAETKWVPVSADRFSRFVLYTDGFSIQLQGEPGEQVELIFRTPAKEFKKTTCVLPPNGLTHFYSATESCLDQPSAFHTALSGVPITLVPPVAEL